MSNEVTIDRVVEAFIATRDEIAERKKALDAELSKLEKLQDARRKWLDEKLRETGVDSMKSAHGTIFYTRKESLRVADWDKTLEYIKSHDAWELLTKSVNKTAALELMGEERDIRKLPGVDYTVIKEVTIRRK